MYPIWLRDWEHLRLKQKEIKELNKMPTKERNQVLVRLQYEHNRLTSDSRSARI